MCCFDYVHSLKMNIYTVPDGEDSEDSIVEVKVPRKPTPPLIQIEEDEFVLNIRSENRTHLLATNFIRDNVLSFNKLSNTSIGMTNTQCVDNPSHWTQDMIKFYNDDWGGEEDFVVEKIQEKMSKTPSLWQISRKDYLRMKQKRSRKDIKCANCRHYGHHISMCTEPPWIPKCFMCGNKGHNFRPCPHSKCLNCGKPTREYVQACYNCRNDMYQKCTRCQLMGHNVADCTDHWRLYHLTTSSVSVVVPEKDVHKPEKDMWCCNCGHQGHHQNICLKVRTLEYRDTLPFVVSYQKEFQCRDTENKSNGNHRKRFKEKNGLKQMGKSKMNELSKALNPSKFNFAWFNHKKFRKSKKRNKKRRENLY